MFAGVNTDKSQAGSLKYLAPEILSGKVKVVHPSQDIWAIGCILFGMLFGELPFNGKTNKEIISNVVSGNYTMPHNTKSISLEVKDLLYKLLMMVPHKRIIMKEIYQHPWFLGISTIPKSIIIIIIYSQILI